MYTIGLIDDEDEQLKAIRRTIKTNADKNEFFDFKTYELANDSKNLIDDIFKTVMTDIENETISSLIIDFKIMVKATKVKGSDIFIKIKDVVPYFPIIILTEVVEESKESDFIDSDKVYRKKDFFKLETDYSKEKVKNIFDSIKKYTSQRDKLSVSLKEKKRIMIENMTSETIQPVLDVENKLKNYIPVRNTEIDAVFDKSKIKEIVDLIDKANELLRK